MNSADEGSGRPDGNAGAPASTASTTSGDGPAGYVAIEEEFTAIVRRAALLGIPAWRICAALGRPLPD